MQLLSRNNPHTGCGKSNPLQCFVNISTTNWNFYKKIYAAIFCRRLMMNDNDDDDDDDDDDDEVVADAVYCM